MWDLVRLKIKLRSVTYISSVHPHLICDFEWSRLHDMISVISLKITVLF